MAGSNWWLARDGKNYGPLSEAEFGKLVELGHLRDTDLVWCENWPDWKPASIVRASGGLVSNVSPSAPAKADSASALNVSDPDRHVFVSYAKKDWAIANALVQELKARGFDVWWDRELRPTGSFRQQILKKLATARAVVVIWSEHSAVSDWVIGEARTAQDAGKLVATRLPGLDMGSVPGRFREHQAELIDDVETIASALDGMRVPRQANDHVVERPEPGDRIGRSLQAQRRLEKPQVGQFLPVLVLATTIFVGVAFLMLATVIGNASVWWKPPEPAFGVGVKQVGFLYAINWSMGGVIIFPLIWFLICHALGRLSDIERALVKAQMLVTTAFEPVRADDRSVRSLFRDARRATWVIALALPALIALIPLRDFNGGVRAIYVDQCRNQNLTKLVDDSAPGQEVCTPRGREVRRIIPLDHEVILRDWSMSPFLTRDDGIKADVDEIFWFVAAVYLVYPSLGVGVLCAYFFVLVGIGMMMSPDGARRHGLMILPDLESKDCRLGFECFESLFKYSLLIMILAYSIAHLLVLQNLYLRVASPSIFEFIMPDLAGASRAFAAGEIAKAIDYLIGNAFAPGVPSGGLLGLAGRCAAAFMPVAFLGIAYLLLRASALRGRNIIRGEIKSGRAHSLLKLTDLPEAEIMRRLDSITTWPLTWPSLRQILCGYGVLLSGIVFYKLGFVFVLLSIAFVVYVFVNSFHEE